MGANFHDFGRPGSMKITMVKKWTEVEIYYIIMLVITM